MMPMPFNMNMNQQQMKQTIQNMVQRNPSIANNPQAQQYLQVIMSGDAQKGQELARNICGSFGVSPEQGIQQAQQFFSNMFNNQPNFRGG